jgi:transcriptional regulator with XRE-family HTH domain
MSDEISLRPDQCRAARAFLGWSREELAKRCKVSNATLADFEAGKRTPYDRTLADIRKALEDGGIQFIAENGGGPGVRLRRSSAASAQTEIPPALDDKGDVIGEP